MNKGTQVFIRNEEAKFVALAVTSLLGDLERAMTELEAGKVTFTPEALKDLKEMVKAGRNVKEKLIKLGFNMKPFPDLKPGDEDEFIIKPK